MTTAITLPIDQACDYVSPILVATNGDGNPNGDGGDGVPLSLAGWTAVAHCRSTPFGAGPNTGAIYFTLTETTGIILTQDDSGEVQFKVTHTQAASLAGKSYMHIVFTDPNGNDRKAVEVTFVAKPTT